MQITHMAHKEFSQDYLSSMFLQQYMLHFPEYQNTNMIQTLSTVFFSNLKGTIRFPDKDDTEIYVLIFHYKTSAIAREFIDKIMQKYFLIFFDKAPNSICNSHVHIFDYILRILLPRKKCNLEHRKTK